MVQVQIFGKRRRRGGPTLDEVKGIILHPGRHELVDELLCTAELAPGVEPQALLARLRDAVELKVVEVGGAATTTSVERSRKGRKVG